MKERISSVPGEVMIEQQLLPIDINDHTALKALAMEALVEIVQKAPRNVSLVGAIRELMDRIEGRPAQASEITLNATVRDDRKQFGLTWEQQIDMMREIVQDEDRKAGKLIENQ